MVTGFLGPNGAGKSTTMRMILGLDEPTSGPVMVIRPAAGRGLLPATWAADVTKYLPATAGQALTTIQPDPACRH